MTGFHAVFLSKRHGDTLVGSRLDRLSRSLKDLNEMVMLPESNGISLNSLKGAIDTTSISSMLIGYGLMHWRY
ncbi:recombinase family protein [Sodalis endosymbiont of Spalangia cameroni]|uniref:recombinase family protein n=1 Tax=Sodalis praecaptivus TaxID=1239307 RepID=UPI0031F91832